jgi:exodeoxyribonuclease V alpha subunit
MTTEPQPGEVTESSQDTTNQIQGLVLDTEQELAVTLCQDQSKRIVSVTGPAGTGKTTLLKKSFASYIEAGYRAALAAPTGKAAKRIQEVTGFDAMTIHRLLKFTHPGEVDEKTGKPFGVSQPRHNRNNPLEYDVLFVDEYTMVNHQLHRDIIDAMKPGSILRCFGDINQLPPIEHNKQTALLPSPFKDILERFPSVTLKKLHRQGEGSDIAVNANRILYGMCPVRKDDFELVITNDPVNQIKNLIVDHPDIDFASPKNQIITTQNRSWVGVHSLNGMLQPMFHETMAGAIALPRSKWEEKTPIFVKKSDKILWTNNDYNLNIFNGEQGIIREIYDDGSLEIDFGDRIQVVPPILAYLDRGVEKYYDPRKVIWLSYAITTHKSQGSEYEHVIYVLNKSCYMMLNRPNFYTAVTRARKHVFLVTDASSMMTAASTTKSRL